jgi:hypothetical protein
MLVSDDMERLLAEPEVNDGAAVPDGGPPPAEEQTGEAAGADLLALLDAMLGVGADG